MPNHITNVLVAPKHVIDSLVDENGDVDFNTVIPIPDDDDPIFTASKTDYGFGVGWSFDGFSPIDWGRAHWGTKWNAYETKRKSDTEIQFDTAWSHPQPVIDALSEKFPKDTLTLAYADEDLGHNLGAYQIKNGNILDERTFDKGSDEALDFASQIKYGRPYAEQKAIWDAEEAEWEAELEARKAKELEAASE